MKTLKYLLLLFVTICFAFTSCNEDDDQGGDPKVKFIRVTDPNQADSLIEKASMGSLIAIIGENLGSVKEIWFNDQKALVTPTYVTESSILVNIPGLPPKDINNKMTMKLRDGRSFEFDFVVSIPAPVLSGIKCEYVPDGEIVELMGDFFFDPKVYFTGDVEAEVVEFTQKLIKVKVPEGAQVGPIEVKTSFGKIKSGFRFRDDAGVLLNMDDKLGAGWHWHPEHIQSDPAGVSGKYYKFYDNDLDNDEWNDGAMEADLWGKSAGRPEGPLWEGGITGKALRFEANVIEEWAGGYMQFIFAPWDNENNDAHTMNDFVKGLWKPWDGAPDGKFKTEGWITVTIPLEEFKYDHNANDLSKQLLYPNNCGSLSIFIRGKVSVDVNPIHILIDNVRVVDLQ